MTPPPLSHFSKSSSDLATPFPNSSWASLTVRYEKEKGLKALYPKGKDINKFWIGIFTLQGHINKVY